MVASDVLDFLVTCPDVNRLPFFNITANANRFVYFCRAYNFVRGGHVLVYCEDKTGNTTRFTHISGRLDPLPEDHARLIEQHLGKELGKKRILELSEDEARAFLAAERERMLRIQPVFEGTEPISAAEFRQVITYASTLRRRGPNLDEISESVERFVVFDGQAVIDVSTDDELVGKVEESRKIIWTIFNTKLKLATKLMRK